MSKSKHSMMFERLKDSFDKGYITKETLQGWVKLHEIKENKGITKFEYTEITGDAYE